MQNLGSNVVDGERTSGQDVRTENVTACLAVSNIVKSSLGPQGLDKMMVDEVGEVTVTNDGATIVAMLDVEHPAAKVLVDLAGLQDKEVGDGTTSVILIAAELLRRAVKLVQEKIHATTIIAGYRFALKEAVKAVKASLLIPSSTLTREQLVSAATTSMSSKIIGTTSDFFATMCVDAVQSVGFVREDGKMDYPVKAIRVLKAHGRSMEESELVNGFALNCTRSAQGMPKTVLNAKIALLDFDLRRHRTQLGVQVLVKDPKELEAIMQTEVEITKSKLNKLIAAGANVIMTTKAIDDLCSKFMVEAGVIGVRRVLKRDLVAIAHATGGVVLPNLADLDGEESVDASVLGEAGSVSEERVGDGELIYLKDTKTSRATTIVLRGANEFFLDEVERSLHDALCVVQKVLKHKTLVAGGGAVEAALSIYLDSIATTLGSREQLAVQEFAEALLVVPKTLAVNAAQDATELVSRLCSYHHTAQRVAGKEEYKYYGLDLMKGDVVDNCKRGIVEPAISKIKSLRFATEAAISILRIDDRIKIQPKQQQQ